MSLLGDFLHVFINGQRLSAYPGSGVMTALHVASVTLNAAQIKALPTTPITIVAAPASGYRIKVFGVSLRKDFTTGFTTINGTYAALQIHYLGDASQWVVQGVVDDAAYTGANRLTGFFDSGDEFVDLSPYLDVPSDGGVGVLWALNNVQSVASADGVALAISVDNNGTGDFTVGAGTLKVTVSYTVEAL